MVSNNVRLRAIDAAPSERDAALNGRSIRARPSPADIEARQRRHVDDVGILGAERHDLHRLVEADDQRPDHVAPPSSCSILVEIEAEWKAGMISTLAVSVRRQNG